MWVHQLEIAHLTNWRFLVFVVAKSLLKCQKYRFNLQLEHLNESNRLFSAFNTLFAWHVRDFGPTKQLFLCCSMWCETGRKLKFYTHILTLNVMLIFVPYISQSPPLFLIKFLVRFQSTWTGYCLTVHIISINSVTHLNKWKLKRTSFSTHIYEPHICELSTQTVSFLFANYIYIFDNIFWLVYLGEYLGSCSKP